VLDRGFSRSVGQNQLRALVVTLLLVAALLFGLFRSLRLTILAIWPALLTTMLMFGVMGLLDIAIDLGTSLTAGIVLGAGSAFATHDLWYRRRYPPDEVSRHVGPVLWLSILLVSVGFGVLAVGRSPVLHRLGLLAGASLLVSALLTSLLVPAVSNKVRT
jgi:uncharacterized protein